MTTSTLAADGGCTISPLCSGQRIPRLIESSNPDCDLAHWAQDRKTLIDSLLMEHRALLFRGFNVRTVADFERFVSAASRGERLSYRDRSTPREDRGKQIYTSTVYPSDQTIHLHNEGTYWMSWALKLFFCCLQPSDSGGETPIADVRGVHDRIDPTIRQQFLDRKMMLVRNFNDGFGLTWQEVFQTENKAEVERYCSENSILFEWKSGDRLRTRQVRPAIRTHPQTGEPVWFNHAAFFHISALDPAMQQVLLAELGEDGLPYNTFYGDGGSIDAATIEHIRDAYRAEKVKFLWREGDVMLVDNMSVAHAREPYSGHREVIVAMTEAYSG